MHRCHNTLVDKAVHPVYAVLMTYNPVRDAMNGCNTLRITLPEGRDAEQNKKMTQLAKDAKMAWEQDRHRDWYAAKQDGEFLLNLFRQQVALPLHCLLPFTVVHCFCPQLVQKQQLPYSRVMRDERGIRVS